MLLGTGTFAAVLVADPWLALAAGDVIYLALLPLSVRSFRRLKRAAEEMREVEE
jgi:CDP-diacylglycerol--serine O-phosphatidyltransferase